MNLIVLSPFVYYPAVPHGGGALCWGQLAGIARDHEVHFLAFAEPGSADEQAALPHLRRLCSSVTIVPRSIGRAQVLWAQILLLLRQVPIGATFFNVPEMAGTLRALITKVRPDAVVIQFPQMAQYVVQCEGIATVMDVQDAFSVSSYRLFKSQASRPKKAIGFLNWLAWVSYESRWYSRFSAVAALTRQDQIGLEIFNPGLGAIASPAAVTFPAEQWRPNATGTMAYIGSYAHQPNVDALLFFITEILPLVVQQVPEATLLVAGKGVPAAISAWSGDNVRIVGVVPDAYEFVRAASVVIVPLRSGGGIKIKTLEAMACGCPVVATSIGAEETGARPGVDLLVADSAVDFAAAVVAVLKSQALGAELGNNARQLIEQRFSWQAKQASLNLILERAMQAFNSRVSPST